MKIHEYGTSLRKHLGASKSSDRHLTGRWWHSILDSLVTHQAGVVREKLQIVLQVLLRCYAALSDMGDVGAYAAIGEVAHKSDYFGFRLQRIVLINNKRSPLTDAFRPRDFQFRIIDGQSCNLHPFQQLR